MAPTVSVILAACAVGDAAACALGIAVKGRAAAAVSAALARARVRTRRRERVGVSSMWSEGYKSAMIALVSFRIRVGGGWRDPHVDMVDRSAVDIVMYLSRALIQAAPFRRVG